MAGSYSHITTDKGKFRGTQLIDNLGDAYEALEECYGMIQYLADALHEEDSGDPMVWIDNARRHYTDGLKASPGRTRYAKDQGTYSAHAWGEGR